MSGPSPEPAWLDEIVAPLASVMAEVNRQMSAIDQTLVRIVRDDPVVRRLCTAPGIGPVAAIAFVSTIDRVERFDRAHQVRAVAAVGRNPVRHAAR